MRLRCPTCQETIEVGTLKALQTHIKKCGATPGTKVNPLWLPTAATTLPPLPFRVKLKRKWESQNQGHKQHWTVHQKLVKGWRQALEAPLSPLRGLDLSYSRWSFLRLIPAPRGRVYDYANLVGGGKAMVDALTYWRIIHDDSPTYFEAEYAQAEQPELDYRFGIQTVITLLEARR